VQALGADAAETKVSRSFLFVPADSERKLAKARDTGADALIIDLEDSIAASARPKAREIARDFLADKGSAELWVRINPLDTEDALQDLRAVMPPGPRGIILPKHRSYPSRLRGPLRFSKCTNMPMRRHGFWL